jgi:hypothetical protein
VTVSKDPVAPARADPTAQGDGFPHDYYFVGADGALGYTALPAAEVSPPVAELQAGFAVSILEVRNGPQGDPFGLTTKGLWLPVRNLSPVQRLSFHGYDVTDGKLDRGWVVVDTASVYESPGGPKSRAPAKHGFDTVPILGLEDAKGRRFVQIAVGAWLDGDDVRLPELSQRPPEARPAERWIDVSVASQVVTAYEGDRPVFTTLASTGVGHGDEATATPLGVHRVWAKLRTTDMTNLEDEDAERYYSMEEVPWVLFFTKGYGLHGAFWHRSFGHVRSHGCVNLTPADAERLFRWASPHLPAGWTAVLPTDYDPGTLVRVR